MMATQQSQRATFERLNIESLERFVDKTVARMAASTSLKPSEALDVLENIQVEMVGELRNAVKALGNDKTAAKRVDPVKLSWEIEKAIEAISVVTDLNADEIAAIFSKKPGASLADVSYRLC